MDASPSLAFQRARTCMVDGQIRPNRVRDPRILAAMRSLPRERFVPPGLSHLAYVDEDVPLGGGRVLIEPLVIARLVTMGEPQAGERALVVASGTGYGAALLAACGVEVTALEEEEALQAIAGDALRSVPPESGKVTQVSGPLAAGWTAGAPYDLIVIEGAVREIAPAIAGQLRVPGGRLVTVMALPGGARQAVLAEHSVGGLRCQSLFDCATPLIPALLPKPAFVF